MSPVLFWSYLFASLFGNSILSDEVTLHTERSIHLVADFQTEIGCLDDWDVNCARTEFKQVGNVYRLNLNIPAGTWNFKIHDKGIYYGRNHIKEGTAWTIKLNTASNFLFEYAPSDHKLNFQMVKGILESRSMPPLPTITLTDTLIFDPNGNMTANPADSIRYTIILRNETGQSVLNAVITHTGDPNVTYDPNSLKASPLAFNDTLQFLVNPMVLSTPGILNNDFDLNDPLPNPPFYFNLFVHRVESNQANVGNTITTAAGGMITLNMDGSLSYDSTGVNGAVEDSIHYTIKDADGYEDSAIIFIQFNLPPVIASNLAATDTICAFEQQDTFVMTTAFTIMDDEPNSESAKIVICNNYLASEDTLIAGPLPGGITAMWTDGTGTLMLMGTASLADYKAAIESIQYTNQSDNASPAIRTICITVFDGVLPSNQVTRLLKVKPVNDCPTAVRDSISILENTLVPVFSVLTNDTDPDLDVLSVTEINNAMTLSGVVINGGTVSLDAMTGNLSFTQTTGFNGLDSLSEGEMFFVRFGYSANDGLCEDSDSVIIKITGVNDAPLIASNLMATDSICAFEQRDTFLVTGAFTILDDEDNTDSAKISICLNYMPLEDTLIVPALPGGITFSWNETTGTMMLMGSASKAAYESTIESIQYTNQSNTPDMTPRRICITVHDSSLLSNQVTRELKIKPVNDCPVAVRDSISILENADVAAYNVLSNDLDLDMNTLSVTKINNAMSLSMVNINGGRVTINGGNGNMSFTQTTGFTGLDSLSEGEMFFVRFSYSAFDGQCEDADSVIIKITGVNDAPLIASNLMATDSICAFEQRDTFLMTSAFTLLDDETNTDSAKISICLNYMPLEDTLIVPALPGGITFSWNETTGTMMLMGSASKAAYESAIESIQYTNQSNTPDMTPRRICITVHDSSLLSNQVTRELKIKPVNDCPVAVRDTFLVNENASFPASDVLDNDTDLDMDMLSAIPAMTMVNGGTASVFGAGGFSFAPTTGAMGLDTLNVGEMFFARTIYTISDGACMDSDSVIIKITGVNDNPIAGRDSFMGTQSTLLTVAVPGLLADDDDIDHNSIIIVGSVNGVVGNVGIQITLASGAKLTVQANGSFVYTPQACIAVIDSFQYQVVDENDSLSNTVTVIITLDQSFWFVDDGAAGNGSFSSPFNSLSQAESASGPGDYIFVFPGTHTGGITLQNNQKLIGADENWICPVDGSLIPKVSGTSDISGGIELAQNDTIRGITAQNNTGTLASITDMGSTVGNLLIANTNLSTSSTSAGIRITSGGSLNVSIDLFNSTSPNKAIALTNCTGNLNVSSGTINPTTGGGDTLIVIRGGTVSMSFSPSMNQPNNFPLVFIGSGHATGTVTFLTGTLLASNGFGLQFNNADGIYNFNGTTTLNGGQSKIDILNGSGGTFSFSSNTSVTNPLGGAAFNIVGGTASGTYSGNISITGVTNPVVSISGGHSAGTVTFQTGTLSATIGTGLQFDNADGTYNFNGTATMNGGMAALDILNGSGGIFSFSSNTSITSPSDTAFNLRTGTASVTYSGNIIQANNQPLLSISAHTSGTITFQTGTLNATSGTGLQFNDADGTYNFNGTTSLNGGTAALDILAGSGGTFSFSSNASITSPADTAFNLRTGTATVTYSGNITQANNHAMVFISGHTSGNITFQTGTLNATNGTGLQFDNADGTYNFNGTTTMNGGDAGIDILNASGGTFSFASGAAITNPTNEILKINGSTANVTYSGTFTKTNNTANGIFINGETSGTININGTGTKRITNTSGNAINLTSNTGATINFSGNNLVDTTTSGIGFNATGGGTINVTGTGNTITSTTGTALNVDNTTIGVGGLNFQSISANGGSKGISLNTTGSGGLTVTGTGTTPGSGGTIQNISTRGAEFISASNINLKNMNFTNACTADFPAAPTGLSLGVNTADNAAIHLKAVDNATLDRIAISGSAEHGINGHDVNDFNLTNSSISNAGNAADEDGIHFFNMSGMCNITSTTINSSGDDNFILQNNTNLSSISTVGTLNITGGSFTNAVGGSGILFGIRGSFNTTINITGGVSTTTNFSGGIVADAFGQSTMDLTVSGCTSSGNNDQLSVSAGDSSNVDLVASGNTLSSVAAADFVVISLLGSAFDTGYTLDASITGNTISVANGLAADGIFIFNAGGGLIRAAVTNNNITYSGGQRAIIIQGGQDGASVIEATVTGNQIVLNLDGTDDADNAIVASSQVADPSGAGSTLCIDVGGAGVLSNTITHPMGGVLPGGDIRVRQRFSANVKLPGYMGGATDIAAAALYLDGRNNEVTPSTVTVFTGMLTGGGACAQPSF